jgi:hypothetical protein
MCIDDVKVITYDAPILEVQTICTNETGLLPSRYPPDDLLSSARDFGFGLVSVAEDSRSSLGYRPGSHSEMGMMTIPDINFADRAIY